jgi:nucleoside-diphosphate-sugar epimerase
MANLPASPSMSACAIDYADRDGLAATLGGAGCVVHLAGILFESPASSYQTANVDATQAVVDACRRAGVRRIVLASALGADTTSPNRYWRSKGRAERIVSESGLGRHHPHGDPVGARRGAPAPSSTRPRSGSRCSAAADSIRRGCGRSEPCHPAPP